MEEHYINKPFYNEKELTKFKNKWFAKHNHVGKGIDDDIKEITPKEPTEKTIEIPSTMEIEPEPIKHKVAKAFVPINKQYNSGTQLITVSQGNLLHDYDDLDKSLQKTNLERKHIENTIHMRNQVLGFKLLFMLSHYDNLLTWLKERLDAYINVQQLNMNGDKVGASQLFKNLLLNEPYKINLPQNGIDIYTREYQRTKDKIFYINKEQAMVTEFIKDENSLLHSPIDLKYTLSLDQEIEQETLDYLDTTLRDADTIDEHVEETSLSQMINTQKLNNEYFKKSNTSQILSPYTLYTYVQNMALDTKEPPNYDMPENKPSITEMYNGIMNYTAALLGRKKVDLANNIYYNPLLDHYKKQIITNILSVMKRSQQIQPTPEIIAMYQTLTALMQKLVSNDVTTKDIKYSGAKKIFDQMYPLVPRHIMPNRVGYGLFNNDFDNYMEQFFKDFDNNYIFEGESFLKKISLIPSDFSDDFKLTIYTGMKPDISLIQVNSKQDLRKYLMELTEIAKKNNNPKRLKILTEVFDKAVNRFSKTYIYKKEFTEKLTEESKKMLERIEQYAGKQLSFFNTVESATQAISRITSTNPLSALPYISQVIDDLKRLNINKDPRYIPPPEENAVYNPSVSHFNINFEYAKQGLEYSPSYEYKYLFEEFPKLLKIEQQDLIKSFEKSNLLNNIKEASENPLQLRSETMLNNKDILENPSLANIHYTPNTEAENHKFIQNYIHQLTNQQYNYHTNYNQLNQYDNSVNNIQNIQNQQNIQKLINQLSQNYDNSVTNQNKFYINNFNEILQKSKEGTQQEPNLYLVAHEYINKLSEPFSEGKRNPKLIDVTEMKGLINNIYKSMNNKGVVKNSNMELLAHQYTRILNKNWKLTDDFRHIYKVVLDIYEAFVDQMIKNNTMPSTDIKYFLQITTTNLLKLYQLVNELRPIEFKTPISQENQLEMQNSTELPPIVNNNSVINSTPSAWTLNYWFGGKPSITLEEKSKIPEITNVPIIETTPITPIENTTVPPVETTTQPPIETTTQPPIETTTIPPIETTSSAPIIPNFPHVTTQIEVNSLPKTQIPVFIPPLIVEHPKITIPPVNPTTEPIAPEASTTAPKTSFFNWFGNKQNTASSIETKIPVTPVLGANRIITPNTLPPINYATPIQDNIPNTTTSNLLKPNNNYYNRILTPDLLLKPFKQPIFDLQNIIKTDIKDKSIIDLSSQDTGIGVDSFLLGIKKLPDFGTIKENLLKVLSTEGYQAMLTTPGIDQRTILQHLIDNPIIQSLGIDKFLITKIIEPISETKGNILNHFSIPYLDRNPFNKITHADILEHYLTRFKGTKEEKTNVKGMGCGHCGGLHELLGHDKNHNDLVCERCMGIHKMTPKRYSHRDTVFYPIKDSKHEIHKHIHNNNKLYEHNNYAGSLDRPSKWDIFDKSAQLDKRFIKRMSQDHIVGEGMKHDTGRLAYLLGMLHHNGENINTNLKTNIHNLISNHLNRQKNNTLAPVNLDKFNNWSELKEEIEDNPGTLRNFVV